jgi:DNA-binding MurR/RpiR family transcriptional regulator
MSAALLDPHSVAIGFSRCGNTTAMVQAFQLVCKNGARTIAITNYNSSTLAQMADIVLLCATARGSPLMRGRRRSHSQLNILGASSLPLTNVITG